MDLFSTTNLENLYLDWPNKTTSGQTNPFAVKTKEAKEPAVEVVPMTTKNVDTTGSAGAKLTPEGNIPIGASLEKPQDAPIKGFSLEKTEKTEKITEKKVEENKEKTEPKKTGESVEERLERFYGKKYVKSSREDKEKYFEKYLTGYFKEIKGKSRQQQVQLQLTDFKKLLSNTKEGDSYEMMAAKINILEKENQVGAAKNATEEQTSDELRARGEIGVARTIHNCHESNQLELTEIVANSKNMKAIKIGASHTAELADKNQVGAVQRYQSTGLAQEDQKEIDRILINQYGKFAKENEIGIHKIMSESKIKETVEYAASNIYKFDKENQSKAFQVTVNTKNEDAIKAALAQSDKYDKSSIKEISAIAQSYYSSSSSSSSASASSANDTTSEVVSGASVISSQEINDKIPTIEQNITSNAGEKVTFENAYKIIANTTDSKTIKDVLKDASDSVTMALLEKFPNLIPLVLETNPSSIVMARINGILNTGGATDVKGILHDLRYTNYYKSLQSDAGVQSSRVQQLIVENGANSGELGNINANYLSAPVKSIFQKYQKQKS